MQKSPLCFVYSFNHHRAGLELREHLKPGDAERSLFIERLGQMKGLEEYLILDTCNRWELYGVAESSELCPQIWQRVSELFPLSDEELESIVTKHHGEEMVKHLFEVSSGVDSQMIGETEIFGQVKKALSEASHNHTVHSVLTRIFSKAFQAAKWVRTHTMIGRGQVSIGNVSVDLAGRIFGELRQCRVLVVGTGEVGRQTAQALKNRKVESLTFASRKLENAERFAFEIGGEVIPFEAFREHLHAYDIVIACTSAQETIMDRDCVRKALAKRSFKPLFLIDLGLPRNIEPTVSRLSQVFLYNLDDVSEIANANLETRAMEIEECKGILSGRARATWTDVTRRFNGKIEDSRAGEAAAEQGAV